MMKHILLFLICFFSFGLFASKDNIIVDHYTTKNGLQNDFVYCTLKGSDGFIWLGTWYGLCRFDGIQFKYYNSRGESDLVMPPRKIQRMLEERNGNLWIKSQDRKLFLFCREKEKFISVVDEIKKYANNTQVFKLENTEDGRILILTKDYTLLRLESDAEGNLKIVVLYRHNRSGIDKIIDNILIEDRNYISWIGTDNQIFSFLKPNLANQYTADNPVSSRLHADPNEKFTSIHRGRAFIWIGTDKGHIFRIDIETGSVENYTLTGFGSSSVKTLVTADDQVVYACLSTGEVCELSVYENKIRTVRLEKMTGDKVYQAFADSYRKLWFVEEDSSITYFDPVTDISRNYLFPKGTRLEKFQYQDARENGIFFLMPAGRIHLFNRADLTMKSLNHVLPQFNTGTEDAFLHQMLDKDSVLWLSSMHSGVYRVNFPSNCFQHIRPEDILQQKVNPESPKSVRALIQTRKGDLWISCKGGEVLRLDRNMNLLDCYSSIGNVYHMMEDSKNNVWLSTKGEGLVKATPNRELSDKYSFRRYTSEQKNKNSLNTNALYATYEDSRGNIWISTIGGGVNLLTGKDGQEQFYNVRNSFVNYPRYGMYTAIRSIYEDEKGRIWIGSLDGLMSFRNDFQDPQNIEFETFQGEKSHPGITDNDIFCMYKDDQERIWFSPLGEGLFMLKGYDEQKKMPVFESYDFNGGLKSDIIISMTSDHLNNLWLATSTGIAQYNLKNNILRNYDHFDGFPNSKIEENSILCLSSGQLLLGTLDGLLTFSPNKIDRQVSDYPTYIVDFRIFNKPVRFVENNPFGTETVSRKKEITLSHDQSMFSIEFASLNYQNINQTAFLYMLEGYEKDWHFNGSNRMASYSNIPPGNYKFVVRAIDSDNPGLDSAAELTIHILPPWYKTVWAYLVYCVLSIILFFVILRSVMFLLRIKNDLYIEQKLADLKIKFFTNISHELRTPLTLIKGPLQELKEKEVLSDKGQQYLELMQRSTENMLLLVNQILDFRKIQNGKMRLRISLFDLNPLLKDIFDEFRILSEERSISYRFQVGNDEQMIWADRDKIGSVVRNLLSNAFKFTPENGDVLLALEASDGKIIVRVEDTGIGIDSAKQHEVFERFTQADNGQAFNKQGTGIGLALTREIVVLHGGQIRVESTPGKGTMFLVELLPDKHHYQPAEVDFCMDDLSASDSDLPESEEGNVVVADKNTELPTMLIVEDNADLCRMMSMQFDNQFNVITAHDGQSGLKKIHLHHPDIVITDYMMPGMNGLEMLESIRNDFQISHIPVIMLTAKGSEESKTEAISKGANAYITKPFSKEYLQVRIESLLKVRTRFRESLPSSDAPDKLNDEMQQCLVRKDVELLQKIHKFLEDNITDSEYNIDQIALNMGLSRSAFFKKLKSITGLAPVDFVKEFRLNKAQYYLKNSDMTISEVAFAVGFRDPGYFSKSFKKKYNMTPREFLQEVRPEHAG